MNQVEELEQAILSRAERLAAQYRERAKRSRDSILREAAEKRRMREHREEAIAKAFGDRTYRQQVQANELKMQSQLDRVRWNLVQSVERRLSERMQRFIQDEMAYLAFLKAAVAAAARSIERHEMQVRSNARDHQRLVRIWGDIAQAVPGRSLRLAEEPIDTLAGVLVCSLDNRIRVDNTFEGRLARLRPRIAQVILERLLPSSFDAGHIFTG